MNQIERTPIIREDILDQGFYFQSFFGEACRNHLLDATQIGRIQLELLELLANETKRFTNEESSSIRVEKAQQLLQSITYCIGVYLKSVPEMEKKLDLLKKEKEKDFFYKGMDIINNKMYEGRLILKKLQSERLKTGNIAYQDTLFTAIPDFFHNYDMEFAAYEAPCSIDYPLCIEIKELLGIEYMEEYLNRFAMEQSFLIKFPAERLEMLFRGYSEEADELLVNLFELTLTNCLGCVLLEKPAEILNINEEERKWLQKQLSPLSREELMDVLGQALEKVVSEMAAGEKLFHYARKAVARVACQLKCNLDTGTLQQIFYSLRGQQRKTAVFEDGEPMEDEKLRELMEEVKDCRHISDKIAILRQSVHSLNDFTEFLEECFYGDEFTEVFQLLSASEKAYLKRNIQEEMEVEGLKGTPAKEWQVKLLAVMEGKG